MVMPSSFLSSRFVWFHGTSAVERRTTDEHRASRRCDHSKDNASQGGTDRVGASLAGRSNDDQIGSDLDGDVLELLPGRAPPKE
jgi:hypothetical protein